MKKKQSEVAALYYLLKKLLRGMKITLFLLLVFFIQVNARTYSQQRKISLKYDNVELAKVMKAIERQTDLYFFFNDRVLNTSQKVSVTVENSTLERVLKELFYDSYSWEVVNRMIVLKPCEKSVVQEQQEKKIFKVTGVVIDVKKQPLPGVTVRLVGTSLGTATDENGKFEMMLPVTGGELEFSFVGYKAERKVLKQTNRMPMEVVLTEEVTEMDEVVVTGIFTKAKESYTGAVSVITEKELKSFGSRNLLQTLRNIDPTFNIIENNMYGSDPNRVPEIQMRGASNMPDIDELQSTTSAELNTPLVIMDGFEITLQRMMDLDDSEVKSITLLKDASATAIYGSRGANGVIVIETKEPEPGKLTFSYTGGVQIEIPDLRSYDLLNAREKLDLEWRSGYYSPSAMNGTSLVPHIILLQNYYKKLYLVENGVDTYWLSKPLRTGVGHRHNIKLEGGDESFRYSATIQYNKTAGVMKKSERTNFNGGINLSYRHEKLLFRNSLTIGLNEAVNSPYGAFSDYVKLNPYWTERDEKGNMKKVFEENDGSNYWHGAPLPANPLYNATLNTRNTSEYTNIINNFSIEWKPVEGVQAQGRFGVSSQISNTDKYLPPEHTNFQGYEGNDYFRRGSYAYSTQKTVSWDASLMVNYSKLLADKHLIYAGVNMDVAQDKDNSYQFSVEGFPSGNLDHLSAALAYLKDGKPGGSEGVSRSIGFVGNLNYSYDDRYLVDFSYRVDGSSKFGSDRRFAGFWSAGVGWNIHKEKFMASQQVVNRLKLRGSAGVTGANNFSPYETMATFRYNTNDRYDMWLGAQQMAMPNPKLEWQKTRKYDVGVEVELFNRRWSVTGDVYLNRTEGLVSSLELGPSSGFSSYKENVGKVENRGVELSTTVFAIRNTEKMVIWSVTGALIYDDDKILELSEEMQEANKKMLARGGSSPSQIWLEGYSRNSIFVVPSLGIDPSTGKELLLKHDGDVTTVWDAADRVYCGVSQPKYRGNINTMFQYRNLSVNLSFAYKWGGQVYNSTLIDRVENADKKYNVDKRVYYDRWKEPGDITFFKGIKETTATQMSSRFVQDEAEFSCQNVNVSYDFPEKWVKNMGMKRLSVSGDMANLFQISTIKQERGTAYPFARSFSLSLSAMF